MTQNIDKLNDRQCKALIGLSKERFNWLAAVFGECDLAIKEEDYQKFVEYYDRKPSSGGNPIFKSPAEKLFFILYYSSITQAKKNNILAAIENKGFQKF